MVFHWVKEKKQEISLWNSLHCLGNYQPSLCFNPVKLEPSDLQRYYNQQNQQQNQIQAQNSGTLSQHQMGGAVPLLQHSTSAGVYSQPQLSSYQTNMYNNNLSPYMGVDMQNLASTSNSAGYWSPHNQSHSQSYTTHGMYQPVTITATTEPASGLPPLPATVFFDPTTGQNVQYSTSTGAYHQHQHNSAHTSHSNGQGGSGDSLMDVVRIHNNRSSHRESPGRSGHWTP